jgi:hypothetical protein
MRKCKGLIFLRVRRSGYTRLIIAESEVWVGWVMQRQGEGEPLSAASINL